MSIPVNKIVNVTLAATPKFPGRKGFGLLNLVGTSNRIPEVERYRIYADIDGVAEDFQASDNEYEAAQVFFAQAPRPSQLMISRRINTAGGTQGRRIGSTDHDDMTLINDMPPSSLLLTVDGVEHTVTGISFAAATDYLTTASILSAALAGASVPATAAYVTDHFEIISNSTGVSSTVILTAPEGGNVATTLGLLTSQGATSVTGTGGAGLEDPNAYLNAMQAKNSSWYGIIYADPTVSEADIKATALWVEARTKVFGYTTADADAKNPSDTTNLGYFFKNGNYHRTFGVWHNETEGEYAAVSAFARAFTVNFNGSNTTITLKFKQLPTIPPVEITENERLALVGFNLNYYTEFGESAMLAEGVMADGTFFDEVHGLDWQVNAIETNVFGYLYTRTTKVPQTDKGTAAIVQQCNKALDEGVRNGLLAPGVWHGDDLGEIKSGDLLPKGYYVYVQPVDEQNQSDREARKAPPIQIIAKGGGAIHFADIALTFER